MVAPATNPDSADNAFGSDTDLPHRADRSALLEIKRRFLNVNRERLRRVHAALAPPQRDFLELLPLLFDGNHPMMPGYVDRDTPAGVCDYQPGERVLHLAAKVARSFSYERRARRTLDVEALYLMGSSGTIGQSSDSDLDIWLCHRRGLDAAGVDSLSEKATAIARWAGDLGLEVHFFLMSAERFRERGPEGLSSESSGSAQRHLLLDEFYRTGLLVAGLAPLWWQVPPRFESDYSAYVETLRCHRFVQPNEYLDFGGVADITAAEFFGATLWQLFKAVSAPHKSLLKILLLEAYAAEHPRVDLLCQRFKRAVYDGERRLDALDPYALLLGKVEEHLERRADRERLELARRSLYFKSNLKLGRASATAREHWRASALGDLVDAWGWGADTLRELDARRSWRIVRTLQERQALVSALTRSYKSLSAFARGHADEAMVSERDMTVLGRKLFTVFEHKAGKVDLVNHGISDDLSESHLTIHQVAPADGRAYWLLYPGIRQIGDEAGPAPVKRGWTALELVAWCHFNGLLTPATRVLVHASGDALTGRDVSTVSEHLRRHFPAALGDGAPLETYARMPTLVAAGVFANLGAETPAARSGKGRSLATTRNDALNYSGRHENLVQEIDYLVVTSWGEILTFKFQGTEGLMACLCEHLRWTARGGGGADGTPPVRCCAPRDGTTVSRRLDALFEAVTAWFNAPEARRRRFVIRAADRYHVLLAEGDTVTHALSDDHRGLLHELGTPNPCYTSVTFDEHALDDDLLRLVYAAARDESTRFFYCRGRDHAHVFVLDERNALFVDTVPFHSEDALLGQFRRFFDSVRFRQNSALPASAPSHNPAAAPSDAARFHRVVRHRDGNHDVVPVEPAGGGAGYVDVQVIGEVVGGETVFTLYCNDMEFSTLAHGTRVFHAVAAHIVEHRHGNERYPIYITDIDLSRLPIEDGDAGALATIHYLHYKKRIERRLNEALADLD